MEQNHPARVGRARVGRIVSFVVMLFFIVLTLALIFRQHELGEIFSTLKNNNLFYVLLACLFMLLYVALEGASLGTITRSLGIKIFPLKSFAYASVDLYFSAITPSSEGGQPLMIYTMNREGISISKATVTAVLFTTSFTGGLLLCTLLAAFLSPNILFFDNPYFRICLIVGIIVSLVIFAGCILLLRFGHLARRLGLFVIRLLAKIKLLRRRERAEQKLDQSIADFAGCRHYIATHPLLTIKVMLLAFLQRVVFFMVPYFIYLSFGPEIAIPGFSSFSTVFAVQVMTQMSVYALPIPGSAGATEAMLTLLYTELIYPEKQIAASAMLLARGVTFYLNVLLCGLVTLINTLCFQRRQKKESLT